MNDGLLTEGTTHSERCPFGINCDECVYSSVMKDERFDKRLLSQYLFMCTRGGSCSSFYCFIYGAGKGPSSRGPWSGTKAGPLPSKMRSMPYASGEP